MNDIKTLDESEELWSRVAAATDAGLCRPP